MASISTDKSGNRTVQFVGCDEKRRSIRLGKVTMRAAEQVKARVEHLNVAKGNGHAIDLETLNWLKTIGPAFCRPTFIADQFMPHIRVRQAMAT